MSATPPPPASSSPAKPATPAEQLIAMASGAWVTQMIHVAAELGLADRLAAGEREVGDLAGECGADPDSLFRLLRGLASLGVFEETAPRRFSITPMADLLRGDHPGSLRQFARMVGEEHYQGWDDLLHCVRTGESAFRHQHGCTVFEWYRRHPVRAAIFDGAMADFSRHETEALLAAYDFSPLRHLVDVGGGRGELLRRVLQAHDHLHGTLFDQPEVVANAEVPAELEGRLSVSGGDFFADIPVGGDAYLLKHIVHDWGDEACLRLLERIRSAMAPGARLLLLEQVIPPGNAPFPGKLLDLNMLVMSEGGRERTPGEYANLLSRAGLNLQRILPTPSPVSVVEAVAE
ncbi:MAG: methyltransferase [Synechococcaceae cyanobacterium]